MRNNKNSLNFTFRVVKNGKTIDRCQTHSKRRFLNRLRTINWEDKLLKVYLRVSYGKHEDVWGKFSSFYNDGWYENEEDLWLAFNTFSEEEV